jgi:hypothetical protein
MSDVVSSIMVSIGVVVASTDSTLVGSNPAAALVVGVNIIRNGWDLVRRSMNGLSDASFHAEKTPQNSIVFSHSLLVTTSRFMQSEHEFQAHANLSRCTYLSLGCGQCNKGTKAPERIEIAVLQGIPNSSAQSPTLSHNDDPRLIRRSGTPSPLTR